MQSCSPPERIPLMALEVVEVGESGDRPPDRHVQYLRRIGPRGNEEGEGGNEEGEGNGCQCPRSGLLRCQR
jgi:hypothetical protein